MTTYPIDGVESRVSNDSKAAIKNKATGQTQSIVVTEEYNRGLLVVDHINQRFTEGVETTGPRVTATPHRGGPTFTSNPTSSEYPLNDLLFYEWTRPF